MRKLFQIFFFTILQTPFFSAHAIPHTISGENLLTGKPVSIPTQAPDKKGTVLLFLSATCPCSDSHMPVLKKLSQQYKEFRFVAIHSNRNETKEISQRYFQNSDPSFEVVQDQNTELADAFKAAKTPHSFLLSPDGKILYQGGVTDSSDAKNAKKNFLANALEDVSNGKEVREPNGRTLGCAISRGKNENIW